MNDKMILSALDAMKELLPRGMPPLTAARIKPEVILDVDGFPPSNAHRHLLFMMDEIRSMVAQGQREKAFRWLGFLQGAVWAFGLSDLETMRQMNMRDPGPGIVDVG